MAQSRQPQLSPEAAAAESRQRMESEQQKNEQRQGGPEDLMVSGDGGTLPLKDAPAPDYYSKSRKQ